MKKISLFLAVVFGISAAAMADNLVHNGEFERLDAKGNAVGWTPNPVKNGTVKFFATGAPDGGYAQFVLNAPENFSIRQCLNGKVQANTKYELIDALPQEGSRSYFYNDGAICKKLYDMGAKNVILTGESFTEGKIGFVA